MDISSIPDTLRLCLLCGDDIADFTGLCQSCHHIAYMRSQRMAEQFAKQPRVTPEPKWSETEWTRATKMALLFACVVFFWLGAFFVGYCCGRP